MGEVETSYQSALQSLSAISIRGTFLYDKFMLTLLYGAQCWVVIERN